MGWLGSRVASVLDLGAVEPGFKSQSRRGRVTVIGKLFTPINYGLPLRFLTQRVSLPSAELELMIRVSQSADLKSCSGSLVLLPSVL